MSLLEFVTDLQQLTGFGETSGNTVQGGVFVAIAFTTWKWKRCGCFQFSLAVRECLQLVDSPPGIPPCSLSYEKWSKPWLYSLDRGYTQLCKNWSLPVVLQAFFHRGICYRRVQRSNSWTWKSLDMPQMDLQSLVIYVPATQRSFRLGSFQNPSRIWRKRSI